MADRLGSKDCNPGTFAAIDLESCDISDLEAQQAAIQRRIDFLRNRLSLSEGKSTQEFCTQNSANSIVVERKQAIGNGDFKGSRAAMASRYGRHLVLPKFGVQAQEKLAKGSVLVVGAGGLGSPAALYLAGAGIGKLGIADKDVVEMSNLHRQVIHGEASIGLHKADSAATACRQLNSWIQVIEHRDGITPANALSIISQYSVVLDASDNAPTRYLLSDACVIAGKPLVSGAALGMDGQLTVYNYKGGPCYRCVFPDPPAPTQCQRCSDAGVLGVVPGVIGTLQALEAIKIISEVGDSLSGRLLLFDALSTRIYTFDAGRCVAGHFEKTNARLFHVWRDSAAHRPIAVRL